MEQRTGKKTTDLLASDAKIDLQSEIRYAILHSDMRI